MATITHTHTYRWTGEVPLSIEVRLHADTDDPEVNWVGRELPGRDVLDRTSRTIAERVAQHWSDPRTNRTAMALSYVEDFPYVWQVVQLSAAYRTGRTADHAGLVVKVGGRCVGAMHKDSSPA